jgi:hypothetical protein
MVPCASCRHHKLQCIIIRTGEANQNPVHSCASCVALFKECSFTPGEKRQRSTFETPHTTSGHLHGVAEEETSNSDFIQYSSGLSKRACQNTFDLDPNQSPPSRTSSRQTCLDDMDNNLKHLRPQKIGRKLLKRWFCAHRDNPYPTEPEKVQLEIETGLSRRQISDWFSNSRRRQQRQNSDSSTERFYIGEASQDFSNSNPMQRWRNSPPEHDSIPPGLLSTIPPIEALHDYSVDNEIFQDGSFDMGMYVTSVSSVNSAKSYRSSSSTSSAWSELSHVSARKRKGKRRDIPTSTKSRGNFNHDPYQCTFCEKPFKKKYDWQRHEKSVHLLLEKWICVPEKTGTIGQEGTSQHSCAFCGEIIPSEQHMIDHDVSDCINRPEPERTFLRKDHFRQHLRKFHCFESE